MRKWEELNEAEQDKAVAANVPDIQGETLDERIERVEAWVQLVSKGPYYFDNRSGEAFAHTQ